jgi:hypothetical protein
MGFRESTGWQYWKVLANCLLRNPRALRNAISLMALYLHFETFRDFVLGRLDDEISTLEKEGDPRRRLNPVNPFLAPVAP